MSADFSPHLFHTPALFSGSNQPISGSSPHSSIDALQSSPTQTVVFIDAAVADLDILRAGIRNAQVVVLDSQADGIDQITSTLTQYEQLDSVQIISHGDRGMVQLGNAQLSLATLDDYRDRLQSWGNALSETGDLLFFGCNVAAGAPGLTWMEQISHLTQAEVQASDDITGGAAGDWDLEVATGAIEATAAVSWAAQADYDHELAATRFTRGASQYQLTSRAMPWGKAQAQARRLGGNLVIVDDAAEERWLKQTFGRNRKLWTGLTDRRREGRFLWANQQLPDYFNWVKGEPNRSRANAEDFVVMNVGKGDRWDDRVARERFRGIIEIPNRIVQGIIEQPPTNVEPPGSPPSDRTDNPGQDTGLPSGASAIALADNNYIANEADGFVEIALVRTGDTSTAATAIYEVESNGAADTRLATLGVDYVGGDRTVTFAPGETRKVSRIDLINDNRREGTESFAVVMKSSSVDVGTIRTAQVTLLDDETNLLDVEVAPVSERDGRVQLTLTRSNFAAAASIDYDTQDETALEGRDYVDRVDTVRFAAGERSKTLTISLVNDRTQESNETFTIDFSNPVNIDEFPQQQRISIIDDDSSGFIQETLITGLNQPTAFARTPNNDLMFIAEKGGVIRTAQNNQIVDTFIDLSSEVNNVEDRGVLSVAVHPQFYNGSPYVYVSYTYDPPEVDRNGSTPSEFDGPDQVGNRPARVVRLEADPNNGYRTVIPGRQVVILGTNSTWANTVAPDGNSTTQLDLPESGRTADGGFVEDYVKTDSQTHTIGHLAFGTDGALYISTGDGASYILDRRAASTLDINSLSGKMLRVDPLTGAGLPDNPFYNADNPRANRSKVWQYGLRNPYRFTFLPGTSTPVIGDVGWVTWEEVNIGARGANFGWPGFEGPGTQPLYDDLPEVQAAVAAAGPVTDPIFVRNHGADNARAITMGDFYRGELFIADANTGDVDALTLNADNQVTSVRRFASDAGFIVFMDAGADGNLYYVDISGSIGRWRPTT